MNLLEGFCIALRALRTLGIAVGVAAVIAAVAVGGGARSQVADQIRSLGANLLLVQPGSLVQGGALLGAGSRQTLTEDDATAIAREVPSVRVAAPAVVFDKAQVVHGRLNWSTSIGGVVPDYLNARDWSVETAARSRPRKRPPPLGSPCSA